MPRITAVDVVDVRFPTSASLAGSDAMHPDGDYSAAYVVLRTDSDLSGHGLTFTIGRGTDVCVLVARQIAVPLVGRDVDELAASLGPTYHQLVGDSQLRWLGPEKGVVHLAAAAVLNAVWDLVARRAEKPLWRLVAEMPPADLVAACDFRYLSDALTRDEALAILDRLAPSRAERIVHLARVGYPAYTSGPGWLGYSDDRLRQLCRTAVANGWTAIKVKVGANIGDDKRRLAIAREELGPGGTLLIDANQVWDVPDAIAWVSELAQFSPLWIEEPTSPDDIVGHATIRAAVDPVRVATGEHAHNRVMFKQLLSTGAVDYCQIDSCRLASVNEIVPVLLMAAKFGVPVCPHAGGVGLCELVQHMSIVDYVCVSGTLDGRLLEYVDHLHEHFTSPVVIDRARYRLPLDPGYSARMHPESIATYRYPDGSYWRGVSARG
jgi:L-fuconate dehydratase